MNQRLIVTVSGASDHLLSFTELEGLQAQMEALGAIAYPLVLRLGATPQLRLQPVTARALLAELERAVPLLANQVVYGILFSDDQGTELGGVLAKPNGRPLLISEQLTLEATAEGLRAEVNTFPPPAGFRSHPGLAPRHYECYLREVQCSRSGVLGFRTAAMGGSDSPVSLPELTVPPLTRWDFARVSGRPRVALLRPMERFASDAYQGLLHGLISACNDSLRLQTPLHIRVE